MSLTMMPGTGQAEDGVLAAASALSHEVLAVSNVAAAAAQASQRAVDLRAQGRSYGDILAPAPASLLEIAKTRAEALQAAARHFRKEAAKAMHAEGMPMDEIAWRLGVTRQRVSTLIREADRAARPDPDAGAPVSIRASASVQAASGFRHSIDR